MAAGIALSRQISTRSGKRSPTVRDGNRAGAVVGRIRSLIRKAPPRRERVDVLFILANLMWPRGCGEARSNAVSLVSKSEAIASSADSAAVRGRTARRQIIRRATAFRWDTSGCNA